MYIWVEKKTTEVFQNYNYIKWFLFLLSFLAVNSFFQCLPSWNSQQVFLKGSSSVCIIFQIASSKIIYYIGMIG